MSRPFPELYNSRRWRKLTARQLREHPLCAACERNGLTNEATLSHHIIPHRGDRQLFFYGELESLCVDCHLIEHNRAPTRPAIAVDGWPVTEMKIRA